jgi:hypothetical protein
MVFRARRNRHVPSGPFAWIRFARLRLFSGLIVLVFMSGGISATEPAKTVGPNACAECHKQEAEAWKLTHHFKTFRDLPRSKNANEIADKMGLKRIKSEGLCLTCHFTVQQKDGSEEPIAGISCESCHSSGADWIKVHSGFSGKTEKTETKDEADARLKLADSKGMIRPRYLYKLAKNCYGCHVVPQEKLVNVGGHAAGSKFELVSWSQGEVLHKTWTSKGKGNVPASAARKRMLYLVGLGVELETALRAVGQATVRKIYAFEMAKRADQARKQLAVAAKAAANVPELKTIVDLGYSAGLKLNNDRALTVAADGISKQLASLTEKYDGSTLAAIDNLIPGPDKLKGTPRKAE